MMSMIDHGPDPTQTPIAVGAIGGSGTRVVARILKGAGVFMGTRLNESEDNLDFTERFRHREVLALPDGAFEARLRQFEGLSRAGMREAGQRHWGWKEPNTHVVIDRILAAYPKMRYVHLLRSGLDMAFSANQRQAWFWGPYFLERPVAEPPGPRDMLAYFCAVHRRISALADRPENRGRVLFLQYEALCARPEAEIARLMDFLGLEPAQPVATLAALIAPPASIGRHREHDLSVFDPADLAYLKQIQPAP
ncbi:hypothetical protein RSWS8N_19154 [Cereibacter sphaeroides WS8N]|nr:hypothetical protein RSWS8N_19154 [Cereibacter sphaeroides WS8N]